MNTFGFYFKQGLDHILDIDGVDHMLFILAMVVFFELKQWRQLLVLVTAFTIGHSITLALSSFEIVSINRDLIEFLIPITIIITCVNNIIRSNNNNKGYYFLYGLVLFFGCIHGLAFSNFLKMSLFEEDSIVLSLLGFNLGIELGQLLIVLFFILITQGLRALFSSLTHKHIIVSTSIMVSAIALWILFQLI